MKPGGIEKASELAYVALVLVVAFLLWREAGKLPPAPYDPLGPAAFPRWAAYGLGGLGIAMAVRLAMGAGLGRAAQSLVTGLDGEAEHVRKPWVAVLTLLLSFAYAALLSTRAVPFALCTGVYLFAGGAVLGPLQRGRLLRVAVVAAVAAIALDQLFRRLFSLDLT